MTDRKYARYVQNSRSYNNIATDSDHNLVIMNIKLELSRMNINKPKKAPQINTANFRNAQLNKEYCEGCNKNMTIKM